MNHKIIILALAIPLLVAGFAVSNAETQAQSGGTYDLAWNSIDGGGVMFATGGTYSLGGTIGQFDAGTQSGGTYTFNGGFWVDFLGNRINLPLISR